MWSDVPTSRPTFSPYVMAFLLTILTAALPIRAEGEESSSAPARRPPGNQFLLEKTYLGHAAHSPDPDEPVEVLQRFLDQGRHGPEPPEREKGREVTIWKKLTQRYPESRYAYAGLGRAFRMRYDTARNPKDLQRSIDAFARAGEIALSRGRILYTRELSESIAKVGSVEQLDKAFGPLMAAGSSYKAREYYLALLDYGDGLAALADERAWEHFERAIELRPGNSVEAINRYAGRLLERNHGQEALNVLEQRLTRAERIRFVRPAYLRKDALVRLGMDVTSADEEIEEIRKRMNDGTGIEIAAAGLALLPEDYAHLSTTDDCRSTTYAARSVCVPDGTACYSTYLVNLAEILWNEARGEDWGQKDMVGWTVRNRALQGVSCNVYIGGVNYTSCRQNLPCSSANPEFCTLSRYYCCVEHGATTSPGTAHSQFDDAHVSMADLEWAGLLIEAYDLINGRIPDPSTNFVPSGISGCSFGCGGICTTGANQLSPSPHGPMEYLDHNYCAARQTCMWYSKNVCGDLPTPSSCSTGGNTGDNHFWNRNDP